MYIRRTGVVQRPSTAALRGSGWARNQVEPDQFPPPGKLGQDRFRQRRQSARLHACQPCQKWL